MRAREDEIVRFLICEIFKQKQQKYILKIKLKEVYGKARRPFSLIQFQQKFHNANVSALPFTKTLQKTYIYALPEKDILFSLITGSPAPPPLTKILGFPTCHHPPCYSQNYFPRIPLAMALQLSKLLGEDRGVSQGTALACR